MITVNNPAITIDKLLIAPSISPNSKAFDVPIAWALLPRAKPIATGCLILNNLQILLAMIAPRIPVIITIPTVMVELPPSLSETPIAIAVVIYFGKSE